MRYIVKTWDGYSIIMPCWRKAKQALRTGNRESYCATARPYRGTAKNYTEGME